jgi:hypothetical protein
MIASIFAGALWSSLAGVALEPCVVYDIHPVMDIRPSITAHAPAPGFVFTITFYCVL